MSRNAEGPERTPIRLRRRTVVAVILLAVVEWLLFELVRVPYRPPEDMLTLLGHEKYSLYVIMLVIFVAWMAVIISAWRQAARSRRAVRLFAVLLICVVAAIGAMIAFPLWPVTPFRLILR